METGQVLISSSNNCNSNLTVIALHLKSVIALRIEELLNLGYNKSIFKEMEHL